MGKENGNYAKKITTANLASERNIVARSKYERQSEVIKQSCVND